MIHRASALVFVVVVVGVICGSADAQTPTLPPDGSTRLASPTCGLQNSAGLAATEFRTGDEFILRGTTYPADELVLVTFRQPPRVVELARFTTNAQGEFTSEPTVLRIPTDAGTGPAAIRVDSSAGSATCDMRVTAPSIAAATRSEPEATAPDADETDDDLGLWFVVWSILLAIGAAALGYLRYRRWQQARLEQQMTQLNGDPRKARVFKADSSTHRQARRIRLGDVGKDPSPPVLRPGWDAGNEPTPARPPPPGHE